MGSVPYRETPESSLASFCHVRTQSEVAVCSLEEAPTRTWPRWQPDPKEIHFCGLEATSLWSMCYSSLNWLRQYPRETGSGTDEAEPNTHPLRQFLGGLWVHVYAQCSASLAVTASKHRELSRLLVLTLVIPLALWGLHYNDSRFTDQAAGVWRH